MRRTLQRLALAAALAMPLAAGSCQHFTFFASKVAIETINLANAMGVDPWQASPEYLAELERSCAGMTVAATMFDMSNEGRHLCSVVMSAAREGGAPL